MTAPAPVLLVSHSGKLYGAERSLLSLAAGLRAAGRFAPTVWLPRRGPLGDALAGAGVEHAVLAYQHWIGARHRWLRPPVAAALNLLALRKAHRALRGRPPALVYTNTLATPFGALLARRLGVPHVWHARELVEAGVGARFDLGARRSLAFVARSSARVVCNSHTVAAALRPHLDPAQMAVVYNGVELAPAPAPRPIRPGEPATLLVAGTVNPEKGHADAIFALAALRAAGRDVRLEVLGSGAARELDRLAELARAHGVGDRVRFAGFVDDAPARMATAAAVLCCARREAFGRVAVEAMAAGAPVVAAAAAGLAEVVADGRTGLLYPPGDHAALAAAVGRLLDDPALRARLVRAARADVEARFGVERYVAELSDVFAAVLAGG